MQIDHRMHKIFIIDTDAIDLTGVVFLSCFLMKLINYRWNVIEERKKEKQ